MDAVRFGRGVRALRRRRRWRQRDLAAAAGCSPALITRVEGGRGDVVTPRSLERIAQALGARMLLRLDWNGEALDRLLDADHASIVEAAVRLLRSSGWIAQAEVTFALGGERGSVDIIAWHQSTGHLVVVEVKSVVADAQDTLSKLDRKARLAVRIAPAGWRVRAVGALLVIGESRTNRRRIGSLGETFAAAYPERNIAVRRFLRAPATRPAARPIRGLLFLPARTQATPRHRIRGS
jgi:transcriptional regulator with XRE-family HTH domain